MIRKKELTICSLNLKKKQSLQNDLIVYKDMKTLRACQKKKKKKRENTLRTKKKVNHGLKIVLKISFIYKY